LKITGTESYPDIAQWIFLFIPDFSTQIVLAGSLKTGKQGNTYDKQDFQLEVFGYGVIWCI
jgi:hypothetical protein